MLYHCDQRRSFICLLSLLTVVLLIEQAQARCPWKIKRSSLMKWSNASSWPDGKLPGSQVEIDGGRRILLDQTVDLSTLTIREGSALVWDDKDDIILTAEYILVFGEFHIGAEDCLFNKTATIRLKGSYDSTTHYENNRKFLGVYAGGTLEIHGMKKTGWTKLARTIKSMEQLPGGVIYDSSDDTCGVFKDRDILGMHSILWDGNGNVIDYNVILTDADFKSNLETFLDSSQIPDGYVIGLYSQTEKKQGKPAAFTEGDVVEGIIANLGKKISVQTKSFYSAIVVKQGGPEVQLRHEDFGSGPRLRARMGHLDFQVAGASCGYKFFSVLHEDLAYPLLELAEGVINWNEDDEIVVASTDFDWRQSEVRKIVKCNYCSTSQVRVNGPFYFSHFGNFTYNVDERAEVGLLSRNILIVGIMSEKGPEDNCGCPKNAKRTDRCIVLCNRYQEDTFGGQTRIEIGVISFHIEGVELYHMGQQFAAGAYPLHAHMLGIAVGMWFKDNSIHHTFSRCITIHGTDELLIKNNVCYIHLGHAYFLEDSVEQNNALIHNLGLGTLFGTLLMSDADSDWCKSEYKNVKSTTEKRSIYVSCGDLSTFWITHPNNVLSGNSAAGGDRHGFMIVFADAPLTISLEVQKTRRSVQNFTVKNYPLKRFFNNTGHSNAHDALFMDSKIATGVLDGEDGIPENGIIQKQNEYDPRYPPGDPNGTRVWTCIERFTAFKNGHKNVWAKGGNLCFMYCSFADAPEGMSGGTTGTDTGVKVQYSIFIAQTDNRGNPDIYSETGYDARIKKKAIVKHKFDHSYAGSPYKTITGVSIYQGPVIIADCYFENYCTDSWGDATWKYITKRDPVSYSGAISFKKDSTYPTMTSQYTSNLTFSHCDNWNECHWVFFGDPSEIYDWDDEDGTRAAHNLDKDGSLTGTKNTYILRNNPFFTGPECVYRADWGMTMCPYRYIKMELLGKGGLMDPSHKSKFPTVVYRSDNHAVFLQSGRIRREYLLQTYKTYLVDFNETLPKARFPDEIRIAAWGVESQDVVKVGICLPKNADIRILMEHPVVIVKNNYTVANTMKELDESTDGSIYYNKQEGLLFFKIWSLYDRTNDTQQCPAGKCFSLKIFISGSTSDKAIRSCFKNSKDVTDEMHFKHIGKYEKPEKVVKPSCSDFKLGSSENIGAVDWSANYKVIHEELELDPRPDPEEGCATVVGCHPVSDLEVSNEIESLEMTQHRCASRCKSRGFTYGITYQGKSCACMKKYEFSSDEQDMARCSKQCSGNPTERCGGSTYGTVVQLE